MSQATAVQFLKRFYLSNSPMTYHPKQMMLSAVYLATKVENHYISVEEFASKVPKTKADDILAPEFLLTQGLRFTFDVRHPFRGLEGGIMELNEIARGGYIPPTSSGLTSESIKTGILSLNAAEGNAAAAAEKPASLEQFSERLTKAYNNAGSILKEGALLTDVYFIYTPSQIWLSALFVADRPLTEFYLHTILSGVSKSESTPSSPGLESQLRSLMKDCAESMTNSSSSLARDEAETAEVRRIDKKLYQCRNPEKLDLRGMNQAAKKGRDADGEEKVIKKRKVERDLASEEGKQLFGGALQK